MRSRRGRELRRHENREKLLFPGQGPAVTAKSSSNSALRLRLLRVKSVKRLRSRLGAVGGGRWADESCDNFSNIIEPATCSGGPHAASKCDFLYPVFGGFDFYAFSPHLSGKSNPRQGKGKEDAAARRTLDIDFFPDPRQDANYYFRWANVNIRLATRQVPLSGQNRK